MGVSWISGESEKQYSRWCDLLGSTHSVVCLLPSCLKFQQGDVFGAPLRLQHGPRELLHVQRRLLSSLYCLYVEGELKWDSGQRIHPLILRLRFHSFSWTCSDHTSNIFWFCQGLGAHPWCVYFTSGSFDDHVWWMKTFGIVPWYELLRFHPLCDDKWIIIIIILLYHII